MNTYNLSRLPLAMSRRMIGLAGVTIVCLAASSAVAFQVYGAINDKWRAMGGQSSPLGAPRSDEAAAANGGRFNNFQYGFIYWHPRSGAHAVYGLIGEKWNALGRERGVCGYPTSDEYDFQGEASLFCRRSGRC